MHTFNAFIYYYNNRKYGLLSTCTQTKYFHLVSHCYQKIKDYESMTAEEVVPTSVMLTLKDLIQPSSPNKFSTVTEVVPFSSFTDYINHLSPQTKTTHQCFALLGSTKILRFQFTWYWTEYINRIYTVVLPHLLMTLQIHSIC